MHTGILRECARLFAETRGTARSHFYVDVFFFFRYPGEKFYYHVHRHILRKYKVCDINNLLRGKNNLCMKSWSIEWQRELM